MNLTFGLAGVLRLRLVSQIEVGVHWQCERLETPAARQFERRLDRAFESKPVLVLVDVERQRHRRHDSEVLVGPQLLGLIDLLEPLLRRPDLMEIQEEHEPLIIPCGRA